jgi:hypothetical protein
MSAFTFSSGETGDRFRKFVSGPGSHSAALPETIRAKRNRANHPSLSGKRFDATEDRSYGRSALADQSGTEVMHPSSISRGRAQENQNRPGIA